MSGNSRLDATPLEDEKQREPHDPVDIEGALRNIDKNRWERIDIALRNLVYPGNDKPWEAYEKLDPSAKVDHLKHLRDIGKLDDLLEKNRPNFLASFFEYLVNQLGLDPGG